MKRKWESGDLAASWQLWPHELRMVEDKWEGPHRLGFAILLKFFALECRFPVSLQEVPSQVVSFVAQQLQTDLDDWKNYPWNTRTSKYHRVEIRKVLGFREITGRDLKEIKEWMIANVIPFQAKEEELCEDFKERCRSLHIELPAGKHMRRVIRSAVERHDDELFQRLHDSLNGEARSKIDHILERDTLDGSLSRMTKWQELKVEPGKAGIESVKEASSRLDILSSIVLPDNHFKDVPRSIIERFSSRAAAEEPFEIRRHPSRIRTSLVCAFIIVKREDVTDQLVDLLIEVVHKMAKRAEANADACVETALKKTTGKISKLYRIAKASLEEPKGIVENVVYSAASEPWLRTFIQEIESGAGYKGNVRTALHRSYRSHYRRMLPEILGRLEFRCTNMDHKPVIDAIALLKTHLDHKGTHYPKGTVVPLDGIIPQSWLGFVFDGDGDDRVINRTAYEICVLRALREKIRVREIWVAGARRYRDPEEDLPQDFDAKKEHYCKQIGVPVEGKEFVENVRCRLQSHLANFNNSFPKNEKVKLVSNKSGNRFVITPFEALAEPQNLHLMKTAVFEKWAGTSLLDVLKESEMQLGFTDHLRNCTERVHLDTATLRRRLLLCLFGLGTNTGLKSVESKDDSYRDLFYVRRRFVSVTGLRHAIGSIVNATMEARMPHIWGDTTTACASDSKQFGAWDQNLLTEWHMRYHGRGVMVYWHVEKHSACIYSQLKRVSSSEAGAMINGVLRHCTKMEVDRQYVDTHGQSTIAFAFCNLLGFDLMPRFKNAGKQMLYRASDDQELANIDKMVAIRPINWALIEEQYPVMVKHAVALKLGMTDAESLLQRFTKHNKQHPAYRAFAELGKAIRTIFLCQYLESEELRREINGGLNVVERWNGANDFIFYGRSGEINSNLREDQEVSLLSLHLLQASLVYINTLMIQDVLSKQDIFEKMEARDLAAVSPLMTGHITQYGRFDLDMDTRIAFQSDRLAG